MKIEVYDDKYFMKQAYLEAVSAAEIDEVPVGAVVVSNNQIIARAHNRVEHLIDITAHAEIIALTAATQYLGSKYLTDCTLYVTLEPCPMCAGAMRWAQIGRLVYSAEDRKGGFMKFGKQMLHPKTQVEYGIMEEECGALLTEFFARKRRLMNI